jgi:hypothetical protein
MEEYSREPCPWRIIDDCGGAFSMGLIGERILCPFFLDGCSVADPDPGSGAFLPSGSGMNFFRIPDRRGMFFVEIFLRILVL